MQQGTHLANTTNVLIPRLFIEAQVLVQPEANVVAVEPICELLKVEEVLLERACHC